jgi:hypothetical protein
MAFNHTHGEMVMNQKLKVAFAKLWMGSAVVEIEPVRGEKPLDDRYTLIIAGVEVDKFTSYTGALEHSLSLVNDPPIDVIELSEDDTRKLRKLAVSHNGAEVTIPALEFLGEKVSLHAELKPLPSSDGYTVGLFLIDEQSSVRSKAAVTPEMLLNDDFIQVGDSFFVPTKTDTKKEEVIKTLLGCMDDYQEDVIKLIAKVGVHAKEHGNDIPVDFKDVLSYGFDIDEKELDEFYRWLILLEDDIK